MPILVGSKKADFLLGTSENDQIFGLDGHDLIWGRGGDDLLDGGEGDDLLFGFEGDDVLLGGPGNDFMRGGSGNDIIDGGSGYDRVSYSPLGSDGLDLPQTGVTVSLLLQGVPQDTGHGFDTLIGIEHISGTPFDDILIGDHGGNWLYTSQDGWGAAGNDTIFGMGGDDLISVEIGSHYLDGGEGVDTLHLFDNFFVWPNGATVSLLQQGAPQDTGIGIMTLVGFENLSGSYHADHLTGDGGDNVIAGDSGNDILIGGEGNDTLLGDGFINVESTSGLGSGAIIIVPDASVPHKFGITIPGGADFLDGGAGDDLIIAGGGDDHLDGGEGDDALYGGKGRDLLIGGAGNDLLSGGAGRDTFEFNSNSGHDTIIDFDRDELIVIRGVSGVDDFSDLTITRAGLDTLVTWDGGASSVLLLGVLPGQLKAMNFQFGDAETSFGSAHASGFHVLSEFSDYSIV